MLEVILGILQIHLDISALAEVARFRTRPLLWDRWDGVGGKKVKGHRRLLDNLLNQHCPMQFPIDLAVGWITGCKMIASSIPACNLHRCLKKRHWHRLRLHGKSGGPWRGWWCPWRHFRLSGGGGSYTGRAVMANLESQQIKRDEGETVDGLAIRPTVHLLSEAHQQTGGRHNQVVGFG